MSRYASCMLAATLCLQPTSSVSMSEATSDLNGVYGILAVGSYGFFLVAQHLKSHHEVQYGPLMRDDINKSTAKALMATPEAQRRINNLKADQTQRKRKFFHDKSQTSALCRLKRAEFDTALENKQALDHLTGIVDYLALPEKELDAQLLQMEKMQIFERAGLRQAIIKEASQKRCDESKGFDVVKSCFLGAACAAGIGAFFAR